MIPALVLEDGSPADAVYLSLPSVQARDRRQVEVRQAYLLPRGPDPLDYQLDVFLFLPRTLGVTSSTYPRADFYSDATVYMRLDAPGRSLRELADLNHPRNPLSSIHATLPRLLHPEAPPTEPLSSLCQLHAHELSEAVVNACSALASRARRGAHPRGDAFIKQIDAFLKDGEQALLALIQVRTEAESYGPLCAPQLTRALAFAEEYVSSILDEQVALLSQAIKESPTMRDGQGTAVKALLLLGQFAVEQARLRLESGYAVPWDEPKDYYTYRLGLLKKNLQQALYLNTRELPADNFVRNSAAMLGAGLAATWAFLSQVPMLQFGQVGLRTQMYLLASAVSAYMLKDRIKEWTREYLTRRMRSDDFNRGIYSDALARFGLSQLSGRAREKVLFMRPDQLDQEVRDIRMLHRSVVGTGLELEEVLYYRRRLSLRAAKGAKLPPGFGVREILRINTRHFTTRLDDPLEDVNYFDAPTGNFTRAQLPKVYHANLVLRISARHAPEHWLTRWRLVLTQDGLQRAQPVVTRRVAGALKREDER